MRHVFATALALSLASASSVAGSDQIYFPATDNVTNVLVGLINQETVRIDIASWYLSEGSISIAVANRFAAGVPVRVIGDRGAIFETDPATKAQFYYMANRGVPIRLRFNPTWFPEIVHWKAAIFAGQNKVLFGSANFAPVELAPASSTNYDDETVVVTDDSTLVNAFKTKFDRMWNDTTFEPQSVAGSPPYLKDWADACANEPTGCDFYTQFPNPAPMTINTARLEPDYPMPADLIWGQGPDFNNRLTQEINNENTAVDLVVYRLGVDNITQALLAKKAAGVNVRVIVDANQYTNPLWPEYWLTHSNIDKLFVAGIPIVQNLHAGVTHMKTLITSAFASNASSNFTPNWQRDHDYFVPAATKPAIYQAIKARFQAMWTDTAGFGPLRTTPPQAAVTVTPAANAHNIPTNTQLEWNRAAWATSYDVYLGTSPNSLSLVGNVPAVLTPSPPSTYSFTPSSALAAATTYYWKVVSRTFVTPINPAMSASSSVMQFTTAGSGPPPGPLPSPWAGQDVGAVGTPGTAGYNNGVFSVSGAGTIWGNADSFYFVHQTVSGDTNIVARLTSIQNTSSVAKAGLMIRVSTAADAAHVILDVRPTGDLEFMTRPSSGAATTFLATAQKSPPAWIRLTRSGNTVTGSVSADGTNWTTVGSTTLNIGSGAEIGLVVCSVTSGLNTSTFDNVSVNGAAPPPPPPPSVPSPWTSEDVGGVDATGTASYSNGVFTVQGAGTIWGNSDTFHFVDQPIAGDTTIVARLTSIQNTSTYAKAGVMIRESTAAGAAHVILNVRPTGDLEFMTRPSTGAATTFLATAFKTPPAWLRLTRSGNTVTGALSADGTNWTTVGSTTLNITSSAVAGIVVSSTAAGTLNTSTFDSVIVTSGTPPPPPPPPPPTPNVVIYASDVPAGNLHGAWTAASDGTSPNGVKLVTPDAGVANTANALAAPTDYVDVTFTASAGTPYTLWLRMKAAGNSKFNDSLWVQFSDATSGGSPIYAINSTSGLLVNLANDASGSSLNGWGWQNGAYWLSQAATVTFAASGTHTMRIQVREDGAQLDQIVLSPSTYLNTPPGPISNDNTIVPKS